MIASTAPAGNGIGADEIGAEFAVRTVAGGIGEVVPGQRGYTRGHCQQFRLVVQRRR